MSNDFSTQANHIAEGSAYGGAGASLVLFGLDANEMAVIASAIFAGLSFAAHLFFAWRKDRREERLAEARNRREQQAHEVALEGDLDANTSTDGETAP
jgi:hypothetical protein